MKTSASLVKKHDLIVVLDGLCVLCSALANFVLFFNPHARFMWAQNPVTIQLLSSYNISHEDIMSSIAVFHQGVVYRGSDAFVIILKSLPWFLAVFGYLIAIIPKFLREYAYGLVARNRYSLFGKRNACSMPDPKVKSKFLHNI